MFTHAANSEWETDTPQWGNGANQGGIRAARRALGMSPLDDNRPCNHPKGRIDYRIRVCGCQEDWCIVCDECVNIAYCDTHQPPREPSLFAAEGGRRWDGVFGPSLD
jgi:hypothetical protein